MDSPQPDIKICKNSQDLYITAAQEIVQTALDACTKRGRFFWALAGGNTPRALYQLLSQDPYRQQMPWSRTWLFWGDERSVPLEHSDSNYAMARHALLEHVPIPPQQIFPMQAQLSYIRENALRYQQYLNNTLTLNSQGIPQFDLILLGMGEDGHTASLFPRTAILQENQQWVAAVYVEKLNTWRLSFTYPLINAAHHVMILVTGRNKAPIVQTIMHNDPLAQNYPIYKIHKGAKHLRWLVDPEAAALI